MQQIYRNWGWKLGRIILACAIMAVTLGILEPMVQRVFPALNFSNNLIQAALNKITVLTGKGSTKIEPPSAPLGKPLTENLSAQHLLQKTLTFNVTSNSINAQYDIYLDKDQPLYKTLQNTLGRPSQQWRSDSSQFLLDIFGYILVNDSSLEFTQSSFEIEEVTSIAHVWLATDEIKYTELGIDESESKVPLKIFTGNWNIPTDVSEVIVKTDGVQVLPITLLPRSQSHIRTHFAEIDKLEDRTLEFNLVFSRPASTQTSRPISTLLTRLNSSYTPGFEPLLLGLLYSLPFLLFLRLRRYQEIKNDLICARYLSISFIFLILYFGQSLLRSLGDIAWYGPIWISGKRLDYDYFGSLITGTGVLSLLFLIYIWPSIVKRWEPLAINHPSVDLHELIPLSRSLLFKLIGLLSFFSLVAALVLILKGGGWSKVFQEIYWNVQNNHSVYSRLIIPLLLLLALFGSCLWLMYEFYGAFGSFFHTIVIVPALLIFLIADHLTFQAGLRNHFVVILSLPFLFAFTRTIFPIATKFYFANWWINWKFIYRAFALIALFLIILSLTRPNDTFRSTTSWWIVISMAWAVSRLWIFALLWFLLYVLHKLSIISQSHQLSKAALDTGIVLALSFFFLPSEEWLYILLVFLIGYLLLRTFLFIPYQANQTASFHNEQLLQSVRETISLNEATKGLRLLRKEMFSKLGKGDIDYDQYQAKVNALEKVVDEKREHLKDNRSASIEALGLGPSSAAWERAKIGTRYGFLFALPWSIIFLVNLRETSIPINYTGWLSLLSSGITALLQWPLYGFFLGYFYPHIRGLNGMQKGFYFFVTVFLPTFIATVLAKPATSDVWLSFLLWGLQLFIQCMLLGLIAGDYETLRRVGLGFRHLIDIHDLSSLAAWGSSLLVAIGAAITTLLTSSAASLITSGLKVLLPEIQFPVK